MMRVYILFVILLLGFGTAQQKEGMGCPQQELIVPCRCLLREKEYQIWCSHSDFPRVLEGLKAVGKHIFRPIDELILENNNLPSLPGKAFLPLKVMRLMLRNNNLERVADGWLSGLETSLMELFVVEPELRGLPEESLRDLNVLEAVTIQTNLMKRLPRFSSLPRLRHLQIESQSLLELSPRHFANLPQLERVHIGGSPRLQRLEAGLFQDLPRLRMLNVSGCGIEWMHLRSITRLSALTELVLVGNKIRDAGMVGRGARDLPQLQVLRLDFNEIERLAEADFVDLPSLKKLYLSGNRIQELHRGSFHRVPNLRTLDLNFNRLRRVHPESFLQHSASGLEELWLMSNDLTHVAELRSLLDALPRLTFLDMSFNSLEAIPFGALRGHPTLEHLNLDYNKIRIIDADAFMAMPALRELRLKNNSLSSEQLDFPLWKLPSLKGLDLSGNFFTRLDSHLFTNVPSLRKLDLSGNELTSIDPEIFLLTQELESINLSQNSLPSVHPATFRHLAKLFELDLSHNSLPELVAGLPKNIEYLHLERNLLTEMPQNFDLPALKMLDVSSNAIQRITPESFRKLPQLRKLYLAKNALNQIDQSSFPGLSKLEVLDLADNRIAKLPQDTFKDCPMLAELNLHDNRLEMLVPEIFRGCGNLKVLDVSRNQLTEILNGALDDTKELEVIKAAHNSLVNLPLDLYELKSLRILDLSNNRLRDMRNLNELKALVELRLSKNFIQDLRYGAFDGLPNLQLLDLQDNEISAMETKAIGNMNVLNTVKLNRNRLREIPSGAFAELPRLQMVELQENELKLVSNVAFYKVPSMLMLNLSGNHLGSLEDCGLRGLRSLEMLDISRNEIVTIEGRSLERMEWLVELRMDDNRICNVNGAETAFNEMPRLRVLSLRNNKMMTFPERAVQKLRGNLAVLDIDGNPLSCSCNILWLRVWMQEQSALGPKCRDGSLLRDIRLSRQECAEAKDEPNLVDVGCEEETSQIFSQQLEHWRNRTKIDNKNHLAPSPEESDYFYDEYVDEYPYNETTSTTTTTGNPSKRFPGGNTPVIYAATRNKTKNPEGPKGVIGSPSSSGFTFFGLPLPSLNNFLGNMRMDDGKPKKLVEAERKTAIVNKPLGFYKEVVHRPKPEHTILGMSPPQHPEIHTGFVPLLPGSGGFTPMVLGPEELFGAKNFTAHVEKVNLTQQRSPSVNVMQIDPNNYQQNSPPSFLTKRGPVVTTTSTTTTTTTPKTTTVLVKTTTELDYSLETVEVEEDDEQDVERVVETTARIIELEQPKTLTTTITTIKPPDLETSSQDGFGEIFKEIVENVSIPPEIPILMVTTQQTNIENLVKTQTKATPLSALLIPGGQQPQFRPSGRPSITKVSNPHASQQSSLEVGNIESDDEDDIEDFITPSAHNREAKNGIFEERESRPAMEQPKVNEDDVNSWYFANYNRTNLEPYVGAGNWQQQNSSSSQMPILTIPTSMVTLFIVMLINN